MGSFYATCSITGMTIIDSQSTYIQLLAPTEYANNNALIHEKGLLCANEYAQMFFAPFGFPIKGEYDDYGYLKNIAEDASTHLLEDFFGVRIRTLVILLCNNLEDADEYNIKNRDVLDKITFTYFRGEIYDHITSSTGQLNSYHAEREKSQKNTLARLVDDSRLQIINDKKTYEYFRKHDFYISRSAEINTFILLPVGDNLKDEIVRQMNLIFNYGDLNKHLLPSISGSQTYNWRLLRSINRLANDLMLDDIFKQNDL